MIKKFCGLFRFSIWILLSLVTALQGARADICLKTAAGFHNTPPCTANDLQTAIFEKFSGPATCVNGNTVFVQLQALTSAGSDQRYDVGYFIALDGGSANTGTDCYRDYLPPPLNTIPFPGPGNRNSPYFDAECGLCSSPANCPCDLCGDPEENKTLVRNIGGTTVASSSMTPGPPVVLGITCKSLDPTNPTVAAVNACTSWDNQAAINCFSVANAFPGTPAKCNCQNVPISNINVVPQCRNNDDCNDNNSCTADSCDLQTGVCSNIPIGAGTPCNDGNLCTTNDVCGGTNNAVCSGVPVVCTAEDQCHEAGTCDAATGLCTNPNAIDGTPCNDGISCTINDICINGSCAGTSICPDGETCDTQSNTCTFAPSCNTNADCTSLNQCITGTCIDNFCVFTNDATGTPCNDGNLCTSNDVCQGPNNPTCQGTAIVCTASDQCHTVGTCNPGTGLCSNPTAANGTSCDDGDICTSFDQCTNGTCAGTSSCVAIDECHEAGTCDPITGVCSNPILPNGTSCTINCFSNNTCQDGTCTEGPPVTCSPIDQCHVAGTCDPTTGLCSNPNAPNSTPCDDGNPCTSSDVCTDGVCAGTDNCPDGQICIDGECQASPTCTLDSDCTNSNPCVDATCIDGICVYTNNTDPCDDGNPCTLNDICQDGSCQPGTPITCTTPGICQTNPGTCVAGNCIYGTAVDGTACGTNKVCQGGHCLTVHCTTMFQCYDGNPCTNKACINGNCVYTNNTNPCDDYDACTEDDRCSGGICQAGTLITCTDPGTCELSPGICSEGECEYTTARDGTACGTNMTCIRGKCVRAPILTKVFDPFIIREGAKSTLTITLSNPNNRVAKLTAPLIDILPKSMAIAGSASTTCAGRLTAIKGTSEVTLSQGSIPANGSCMIKVKVNTCEEGSFTNTLPAGALRTNLGRNALPSSATLTVSCESCLE